MFDQVCHSMSGEFHLFSAARLCSGHGGNSLSSDIRPPVHLAIFLSVIYGSANVHPLQTHSCGVFQNPDCLSAEFWLVVKFTENKKSKIRKYNLKNTDSGCSDQSSLLLMLSSIQLFECYNSAGWQTNNNKTTHWSVVTPTLYTVSIWQQSSLHLDGLIPDDQQTENMLLLLDYQFIFCSFVETPRYSKPINRHNLSTMSWVSPH